MIVLLLFGFVSKFDVVSVIDLRVKFDREFAVVALDFEFALTAYVILAAVIYNYASNVVEVLNSATSSSSSSSGSSVSLFVGVSL